MIYNKVIIFLTLCLTYCLYTAKIFGYTSNIKMMLNFVKIIENYAFYRRIYLHEKALVEPGSQGRNAYFC